MTSSRLVWIGLGVVAAAALVWPLVDKVLTVQRTKLADAKAWDVRGPACPTITEAQFLSGRKKGPQHFEYGEIGFYRRTGNVECASIYYDGGRSDRFYPACKFTRPHEILVRTAQGDHYFGPGPGRPATVSVAHGQVRCVMGIGSAAPQ